VRTVLRGGFEHQTSREATVFAEHPPTQLTLRRSFAQHGQLLAESARS
jgi:hypothetical protein